MKIVTIYIAKAILSRLVRRAEAGEEIVLARGKRPVAKIVPLHPIQSKRKFGALRGQLTVGPEFFEPLPPDELRRWKQ